MRYGAMNSPLRPMIEEVENIAELGFDYLELSMDPPMAHHGTIREQKQALSRTLERKGLGLVCHLPAFLNPADLTPALRETSLKEILSSLKVAAALGPLKVVLHPSYYTGLSVMVMDQARSYALASLRTIVNQAEALGLILCIENLFPRLRSLTDPEHFREIFDRFPSLRMTLDIGHAHIGSGARNKAIDFINEFPDRIAHVHASDNFGKEDNHLPIGAGNVDYPAVIRALKQMGYDDTVTLEVFAKDRDYLRISREKFAQMIQSAS
jgi:sugar phosphate isomerase/epimerase